MDDATLQILTLAKEMAGDVRTAVQNLTTVAAG